MEFIGFFLLLVVDAAADAFGAPCGPLLNDLPHAEHPRHASNEQVEVAAEGIRQRRRAHELLHELVGIHAALEVDRQLHAGQIRLVAHIVDLADLARLDQLRDLINDRLRRRGIGDLIDLDEIALLDIAPAGADTNAAATGAVDLRDLLRCVEDLTARGEVGRGHILHQIAVRVFDPRGSRLADLAEVKRADVTRHADRNAHIRRGENVREGGGQQGRLLHGAVIVVHKIDGLRVDIAEDLGADRL